MSVSRCTSCRAEIWYGLTVNGKRMPLDPHSTDAGNVVVDDYGLPEGGPVGVRVLRKGEDPGPDVPRFISHFATCPTAARHRKAVAR